MKLSKLALVAAIACGTYAGNVFAAETNEIQLVSCECGEPACGCEQDCDSGCCDSGCDSGCDSCGLGSCGFGSCLSCGDCCLGDPYTLFGEHGGFSAGGWMQIGYFNKGAAARFNSRPDEVQLQQGWLWAEKALDTTCGCDWGGRVDYLYGTDGPDTQAFGQASGWDTGWTNGADYGSALPQVYGEIGYGDVSVKAGHFYTIIGWEVVQATGNFFYSHAYTMYNSEPFTHTGALATYTPSDDVTIWGGYTLGWDSGFEDNGDSWLGGASLGLTDNMTLIYASVAGRFGEASSVNDFLSERGYMQSVIVDFFPTEDLEYIFQCDWLTSEDQFGNNFRDTIGINQYLIKTVNDCFAVGARFEWWQAKFGDDPRGDVYDLTFGVNYRPHANLVLRPEVRWDWDNDDIVGLTERDGNQTSFALDGVLTF